MFLSTFSHYSGLHLFANMYVLHSFCNPAIISLGKEQFLGLYLSAGVVASFASILYKSVTAQAGLSLGAVNINSHKFDKIKMIVIMHLVRCDNGDFSLRVCSIS